MAQVQQLGRNLRELLPPVVYVPGRPPSRVLALALAVLGTVRVTDRVPVLLRRLVVMAPMMVVPVSLLALVDMNDPQQSSCALFARPRFCQLKPFRFKRVELLDMKRVHKRVTVSVRSRDYLSILPLRASVLSFVLVPLGPDEMMEIQRPLVREQLLRP